MRLRCLTCGKIVSTEVPDNTVVRAALECPECIQNSQRRQMNIFKYIVAVLLGNCRSCGASETRSEVTPDHERPHWRVYCKRCGIRRSDLDGFSDR